MECITNYKDQNVIKLQRLICLLQWYVVHYLDAFLSDQRSVVENLIENLVEIVTVVIVVIVEGIMIVGAGIVIGIMIGIVMIESATETQIALMILEVVAVHAHDQQTVNVQGTMIATSTV